MFSSALPFCENDQTEIPEKIEKSEIQIDKYKLDKE